MRNVFSAVALLVLADGPVFGANAAMTGITEGQLVPSTHDSESGASLDSDSSTAPSSMSATCPPHAARPRRTRLHKDLNGDMTTLET